MIVVRISKVGGWVRRGWTTAVTGITEAWRQTGSTFQMTLLVFPSIGTALFLLSMWGDLTGFWASKPFLTNMASGLIGAMYGVPFALVILQRLSLSQAARLERDAVRRLGARAGEELVSAAMSALGQGGVATEAPSGSYDEVARGTRHVFDAFAYAIERVDAADVVTGSARFSDRHVLSAESAEQFLAVLEEAAETWLRELGDEDVLASRILHARANWEFLTGPVRTRILEAGFVWPDAALIEDCRRSLDELQQLLPTAYLPRIARKTRSEFISYTASRQVLTYSSGKENKDVSLPHDLVVAVSNRFEQCLVFISRLRHFVEQSRKIATLLSQ